MSWHIQYRKDIITYLIWLFLGVLSFNLLPKIGVALYVLLLSFKFIQKKSSVAHLAVYLSIIADLGGLFEGNEILFSVGAIEIDVIIIFIFTCYIKLFLLKKKERQPFLFRKPLSLYIGYLAFLIVLGLVLGIESAGASGLRHYFQLTRFIVLVPIIMVLPRVLIAPQIVERLAVLFFISIFINLAGQFFMLAQGLSVSQYIRPNPLMDLEPGDKSYLTDMLRPIYAPWIVLLNLFFAFYFLIKQTPIFSRIYLYTITFLTVVSIFITATRGWIIAFLFFIIASTFFLISNSLGKIIGIFMAGLGLFFALYITVPIFNKQINTAFERFSTVELILEGDLTAGGTNARFSRGAKVMEGFYESPIFGLGFSSQSLAIADAHAGNQNILMSGGVLGFFVIIYFILSINIKFLILNKSLHTQNRIGYNNELRLVSFFFISLFIIHSTSGALFGYVSYLQAYGNMFWVFFYISIFNKILHEYRTI